MLTGTGYGEAARTGGLEKLPTSSVGLGRAVRLPGATVIFLALAARARGCLALAGCTLRRGRAARLRRPAGLRIAWRSARACLRSRAPDARGRAARGRRCGVATLAELLIHHGPRVLGLWRPIHLGDAGTVAHRGALRLRRPIRSEERRVGKE